jgi:predicted PurR-regulated permease PerM
MSGTSRRPTSPGAAVNGAETVPAGAPRPPDAAAQAATPDDPMREAAETAEATRRAGGLGKPGKAMNHRSPFFVGLTAAAGVAVTYGLVELLLRVRSILTLIGLAFFIAAGLDPVVNWLTRRGLPRWAAVLTVVLGMLAVAGAFLAAAVPPLTAQIATLVHDLPTYMHQLQNHNSTLGRLNTKYHIQQRITSLLSSKGTALVGGILGAGELVLSAVSSIVLVAVLSLYFLAAMPRTKLFVYRLIPRSRRARAILISDKIFAKVGGYVLGNIITSVIAGAGTFFWMLAFGIPYPALLGLLVALLDLIPVIGSTIGGLIVTLVALTVSLPVAIATLIFYIGYRLAEDYLIVPRIIGRTVQIPAVVSLIALAIGGVLLGIIGALIAIPAAAAISLLLDEITFPRLDNT